MVARAPLGVIAVLALALAAAARAQDVTPPQPIPTPPVPRPPQLGPVPAITLGSLTPPPQPVIPIPGLPGLTPVAIPPQAAITPADKSDTTKPPLSASLTGPTAMVSPGASGSQIEEVMFLLDPGASQLSPPALAKVGEVAKELARSPAARLEVRVYSPVKPHNESNARRLSLSRFLAIRGQLIRDGVADGRIDGRPLTAQPSELNGDRVELYIER